MSKVNRTQKDVLDNIYEELTGQVKDMTYDERKAAQSMFDDLFKQPNTVTLSGWVVRDLDGDLWRYDTKPIRSDNGNWIPLQEQVEWLDKDVFPSLTWEDQPKKVSIKITLEEQE